MGTLEGVFFKVCTRDNRRVYMMHVWSGENRHIYIDDAVALGGS